MKQTKKLGRGLEDFSHLFLSPPDGVRDPAAPVTGNEHSAGEAVKHHTRTICIAGERSAGERAFLTVSLASIFAGQGKKVVVVDADFNLPRLCMLMERVPSNSLLNLITHPERTEGLLKGRGGVTLITLDVDIATLAVLTDRERLPLMAAMSGSVEAAAVLLVMTAGDCISQMRPFIESADDIVVVAPRPVAEMINAYGLIKRVLQLHEHARVGIVASRSSLFDQADAVFHKMQRVVKKFLDKPLLNHGYLPDDRAISHFLERETSAANAAPSQETARCLAAIAESLSTGATGTASHPAEDHHSPTLAERLFARPCLHAQ